MDPVSDDPTLATYHGDQNRGTLSINLLGGQQQVPPDSDDLQTFDVAVNAVSQTLCTFLLFITPYVPHAYVFMSLLLNYSYPLYMQRPSKHMNIVSFSLDKLLKFVKYSSWNVCIL